MAAVLVLLARVLGFDYGGRDCQFLIGQITDQRIRVAVIPVGSGVADLADDSTVLLTDITNRPLHAVDDLPASLTIGRLKVSVDGLPLRIHIHDVNGRTIQQIGLLADPNGGLSFRTDAMVLGLGEGAQQFDRRGALYPMKASWGSCDRPTQGSVVPSPFLIGTDGWAIFVHRPIGQFDLRSNPATFRPWPGQGPILDLFMIWLQSPADAPRYYMALTGRPVMPPKWALGYFQSHRMLAGPDEILKVASTFRSKGLPCDGLIYLGTGYCPNGWNTATDR
ncbi:MAG: glycoside hydrolase family 31 protein [Sedimentisphaerales bacterium]|nr:glycoside hydrolase family 31 protein [Sedimentisphaerales bacterium]